MDWAARFIDGIYNRFDSNTYAKQEGKYYLIHPKWLWEEEAHRINKRPVYDEIRKTVRFV